MANISVQNGLIIGIILLFIFSTVSPEVIGNIITNSNQEMIDKINENCCMASLAPTLTLISKSSGLEDPIKEEGKTELELADINNDGHFFQIFNRINLHSIC